MNRDRREDGSRHAAPAADGWHGRQSGEPRLEELIEDPLMGLIWRRDGIDAVRGRATLLELQAIVRAGRECAC